MGSPHHTFGGLGLDRFVFDMDTVETADPLAAGAGAGEATAADPAATEAGAAAEDGGQAGAEPGAPEPAAPAAPDPGFDPREVRAELDYLREQNAELVQYLRSLNPGGQAGDGTVRTEPGMPELDPFDPESVAAWQEAREQRMLEQIKGMLDPLASRFEQQDATALEQEGEQRIMDVIADEVSRNGEFVVGDEQADLQARDRVRQRAEQLFPEYAGRYGPGARAGELALAKAAEEERAFVKAIGDAAVARHTNRTATLAGANGEPSGSAGAAATEQPVVTIGSRVVDRYA